MLVPAVLVVLPVCTVVESAGNDELLVVVPRRPRWRRAARGLTFTVAYRHISLVSIADDWYTCRQISYPNGAVWARERNNTVVQEGEEIP